MDRLARSHRAGIEILSAGVARTERTVTARERILSRLQAARAGSRLPRVQPSSILAAPRLTVEACVLRFEVEAQALGVECYVESSVADVHGRLTTLIEGRRALSWDPAHLPYHAGVLMSHAILGQATSGRAGDGRRWRDGL